MGFYNIILFLGIIGVTYATGSHGVGYGGIGVVAGSGHRQSGPYLVFDRIAQRAVSGANNDFIKTYQAQLIAAASSAQSLDHLQQGGQHTAAYAGQAANQASQLYNAIATGPVSPGYKGGYLRRR